MVLLQEEFATLEEANFVPVINGIKWTKQAQRHLTSQRLDVINNTSTSFRRHLPAAVDEPCRSIIVHI